MCVWSEMTLKRPLIVDAAEEHGRRRVNGGDHVQPVLTQAAPAPSLVHLVNQSRHEDFTSFCRGRGRTVGRRQRGMLRAYK